MVRRGAWVTNGRVAWFIGKEQDRIASRFLEKVYISPDNGWTITIQLDGKWREGICGELRRIMSRKRRKADELTTAN